MEIDSVTGVTVKMYIKIILPQYSLAPICLHQNIMKLYGGIQFDYNFRSKIVLGVCFACDFRTPKHTPDIFVRGLICLPVTPGNKGP